MVASNCAIPGCTWHRKSKVKRSLFTISRPDFARSDEERSHRRALTEFILHLRDPSKGDKIQHQLHKETAAICDHHFEKDDIIIAGTKRGLRCGALPTLHLPHSAKPLVRKIRKDRRRAEAWKQAHSSLEAIREVINGLPKKVQEAWLFADEGADLIVEKKDDIEQGSLVPKLRIVINNEVEIKNVACYGWQRDVKRLGLSQIKQIGILEWLRELEELSICRGLQGDIAGAVHHPIVKWNGAQVVTSSISRSPKCSILGKDWQTKTVCQACASFQLRRSEVVVENKEELIQQEAASQEVIQQEAKILEWRKLFNSCHRPCSSKNNGRRYHPDVIQWAIKLFSKSPSAYRFIRDTNVLTLPSVRTIQNSRKCIAPIDDPITAAIDRVISSLSSCNKSSITLDEVKICENLVTEDGELVGFVESQSKAIKRTANPDDSSTQPKRKSSKE